MLLANNFALVIISFAAMGIAGCGYHLSSPQLPHAIKTIRFFYSKDPYGPLARAVRSELRLHNITIVDDADAEAKYAMPSLFIASSLEHQKNASVKDGNTAEYQIILSVHSQFLMPGKDYYPIELTVYRSFFHNPLQALAKDAEMNIIRQEMLQQFAQQLVRQLLLVSTAQKADNKLHAFSTFNCRQ